MSVRWFPGPQQVSSNLKLWDFWEVCEHFCRSTVSSSEDFISETTAVRNFGRRSAQFIVLRRSACGFVVAQDFFKTHKIMPSMTLPDSRQHDEMVAQSLSRAAHQEVVKLRDGLVLLRVYRPFVNQVDKGRNGLGTVIKWSELVQLHCPTTVSFEQRGRESGWVPCHRPKSPSD
jgi:hypothetical protein